MFEGIGPSLSPQPSPWSPNPSTFGFSLRKACENRGLISFRTESCQLGGSRVGALTGVCLNFLTLKFLYKTGLNGEEEEDWVWGMVWGSGMG